MADNQEARLAAIEASLAELREMIGQLTLQQGIHQPAAAAHPHVAANPVAAIPVVVNPMPANPQQNYQEGYRIKVDLQNFSGSLDVESVLDWLAEVERFFEIMNVEEERKMFEQRFLPSDHAQVLYNRYYDCVQGNRRVDEYTEEFLRLQARCENCENEAQQVAHYQRGLNHEIRCMMGVAAIFTLADAIEMAKRAEERTQQYRGNYSGQPSKVVNSGNPPNTMEERRDSKGKAVTTTTDKGGRTNPYQKPMGDICYRCRQSGHRSNNCPERRGVNADRRQVNIVEQVAETDEKVDDDDRSIAGSKDGEVTYVVKKILCSTKQEDETQRRKIFQAKCRVGEAICRLIIDSCSCENLIAKQLVEKLQLPTQPHPSPYKVGWIKEGPTIDVTTRKPIPLCNGPNRYWR
ncbi:hypothetical protein MANES_14G147049v8 [Manihot esculenta]|uniref:Uncharacterized protein n=1 Tax=Manihot esculenta TaxID=3983 RepID=A0ACB7GJ04_MANES|nr:hypothetical protein MANES_14G147049v8 [Manihot esculenta]